MCPSCLKYKAIAGSCEEKSFFIRDCCTACLDATGDHILGRPCTPRVDAYPIIWPVFMEHIIYILVFQIFLARSLKLTLYF